ncbi:MAG: hypothetical protein QM758_15265 [Armatimonas sp.]
MKQNITLAAMLSLAVLVGAPLAARAQDAPPPVTIDLRDAPIRSALEQIFNSANLQYTIDPQVSGFVTLKIRDQPFENALKLIMRTATIPLTYTKENNVYIVKPRPMTPPPTSGLEAPPDVEEPQRRPPDIIPLTYIDPMDLQQLIGPFLFLRPFSRAGQSGMGGMGGGGMGGGMGGFGGMGGMGGGMGGMGGGMGGFGGMGGMGGGMGGMGGGMGGFGGMGGMGGGMGGMGGGGMGGFGGMGGGGFGGGRGF